jgi:uncharacterized protein
MVMEQRKAIAPHKTATTDVSWDGPAAKANLKLDGSEAYYRSAFAWQDPEGDAKTKAAYKFIHHEVSSDGAVGAANVTACSSGIAVLNGGRGGTVIPTADREGVHAHLAGHLKDAGKDAPELKSALTPFLERRSVAEFRAETLEGGARKLSGYAAIFNSETTIHTSFGSFREVIRPGAFTRSLLEGQDVVAWYQHGEGGPLPLGRTKAGTLRLSQDNRGLAFELDMPDTSAARDLAVSVQRGDVREASFAFEPAAEGGERWTNGDPSLRELLDLNVFDIAPVVFPAYPSTSVGLRSAADVYREHLDLDRKAGLPAESSVANSEAGLEAARQSIEIARNR